MLRAVSVSRPVLQAPSFSAQQNADHWALCNRIGVFKDSPGNQRARSASKALSAAYIKQKLRAGDAPVRNLMLTGAMLNARTIIDIGENTVQLGFTDSTFYQRAAVNERIEPMLGLSPSDVRKLDAFIARFLAPAQLALPAAA